MNIQTSPHPSRPGLAICLTVVALAVLPLSRSSGQEVPRVRVRTPEGYLEPGLTLVGHGGFAAVPAIQLERLGFDVAEIEGQAIARWRGGAPVVEIWPETPFLTWEGEGVQLAEAPYVAAGSLHLPVQFFIDILPWKFPEVFRFNPDSRTLMVREEGNSTASGQDPVRVVVIDPGHGGRDSGARGVRGIQEKHVALTIGRALAENLQGEPNLRVFLTRDTDTLIPIWRRGEMATAWKGDHPGVFISIHANALPGSRATRGFETYFLSEARTEHERRVAALENASQEFESDEEAPEEVSDLSFILTELINLDHAHWSSLLAELIQEQLDEIHPGPNRGVKQGPLAVITNALMPAVLVEVGFLTNPEEEMLLTQGSFQEETADAVASAVREFFQRYPSGGSVARSGGMDP